ncbi:MAG: hypothetical protein ABI458_04465, partial [Chloroflexota bacterium]
MSADRFSDQVYRLIVGGDELPEGAAVHMRTCQACQAAMADARQFLAQLDAASSAFASPGIPDLRMTLGAEPAGRPGRTKRFAAFAAVIALALVAMFLTFAYSPFVGPTPSASSSPSATPAPSESPPPSESSAAPTETPAPAPRAAGWSATGSLTAVRAWHTATLLAG